MDVDICILSTDNSVSKIAEEVSMNSSLDINAFQEKAKAFFDDHLSAVTENLLELPKSSISYRNELKRPDLKGTFRCAICQKVFCHSSSLSRHRMQAHFKSYTCTLCRKEITTNSL